jgi:hypothetical protein
MDAINKSMDDIRLSEGGREIVVPIPDLRDAEKGVIAGSNDHAARYRFQGRLTGFDSAAVTLHVVVASDRGIFEMSQPEGAEHRLARTAPVGRFDRAASSSCDHHRRRVDAGLHRAYRERGFTERCAEVWL